MEELNYRFFADDDYQYFKKSIEAGLFANKLGANAQEICEKYLKHLVSEYCIPENDQDAAGTERVLHTHNLNALINFLEGRQIVLDCETKNAILRINGFYFTTRYPGEESFMITKNDLLDCIAAVDKCKAFVDQYELSCSSELCNSKEEDDISEDFDEEKNAQTLV